MFKQLIGKFGRKTHSRSGTPLGSLDGMHAWLAQLQAFPEYDAHQRIVAMLDDYNHLDDTDDAQQIHILGLIEHAGSKLQYGLINQFFHNQSQSQQVNSSFTQEIMAFYWQLALAYQRVVKSQMRQPATADALPTLVLRALHYHGKLIQWRYLHFELPTAQIWHTLHRLYLLALHQGFANRNMVLKGSAYASSEAVYARILLLHLMHPVGLSPNEIELAAYWSWKWRNSIKLSLSPDPLRHTHSLDLADDRPPLNTTIKKTDHNTVVYWSTEEILHEIPNLLAQDQLSTQIKLYGVLSTADKRHLLQHIFARLSDKTLPRALMTPAGKVRLRCGNLAVTRAPLTGTGGLVIQAQYQSVGHPDEGYFRLHITEDLSECHLDINQLLIIEAAELAPILAVVRWIEQKGSRLGTLGLERLGYAPRLISHHPVGNPTQACATHASATDSSTGIALSEPDALICFNPTTQTYLDLFDQDFVYRVHMQGILEQQADWQLVPYLRLTRTQHAKPTLQPEMESA